MKTLATQTTITTPMHLVGPSANAGFLSHFTSTADRMHALARWDYKPCHFWICQTSCMPKRCKKGAPLQQQTTTCQWALGNKPKCLGRYDCDANDSFWPKEKKNKGPSKKRRVVAATSFQQKLEEPERRERLKKKLGSSVQEEVKKQQRRRPNIKGKASTMMLPTATIIIRCRWTWGRRC